MQRPHRFTDPDRAAADAQSRIRPHPWAGLWRGPCTLVKPGGPTQRFEMELHVPPHDTEAWRLVYRMNGFRSERRTPGMTLVGDGVAHRLAVEGPWRTTCRVERRGDQLAVEMVAWLAADGAACCSLEAVQRGELTRAPQTSADAEISRTVSVRARSD